MCARACASCARVAGGGGRPKAGVREGQSVIRDRVVTQVVVRTLGSVQGSGTLSRGEGRFLGDPRSLQWGSRGAVWEGGLWESVDGRTHGREAGEEGLEAGGPLGTWRCAGHGEKWTGVQDGGGPWGAAAQGGRAPWGGVSAAAVGPGRLGGRQRWYQDALHSASADSLVASAGRVSRSSAARGAVLPSDGARLTPLTDWRARQPRHLSRGHRSGDSALLAEFRRPQRTGH